jgi:transcription antitermination factor NusA-like protein
MEEVAVPAAVAAADAVPADEEQQQDVEFHQGAQELQPQELQFQQEQQQPELVVDEPESVQSGVSIQEKVEEFLQGDDVQQQVVVQTVGEEVHHEEEGTGLEVQQPEEQQPEGVIAPAALLSQEQQQEEEVQQKDGGISVSQKRDRDEQEKEADKKWSGWPGDNAFRLMVPVQKVGGIIGRKGEFVKKMCEDTRSRIKILEGVPGTPERIVLVSAREEPEATISPAMEGLLRVHRRVIEGSEPETTTDGEIASGGGPVASRLLVAATQAGSLIGRQGATIKSIQDASGATVRVLPPEDLPLCALSDDRVVEIQGEARLVQRAMEMVVSHLRKFLVDRSVLTLFELNRAMTSQQQQSAPSAWQPSNTGMQHQQQQQAPSYASTNDTAYYPQPAADLSQHHQQQQQDHLHHHHGVSMYGRDPSMTSVAAPPPTPVITQVTQHMQIPLSYADAVIGTAGANISYMRHTSGATITIQETRGVPGEMTVEIHGSASQVQTAQQLVQNFMSGATGAPQAAYSNAVDTSYSSYPTQASMYPTNPATGPTTAAYNSHYNTSYGY